MGGVGEESRVGYVDGRDTRYCWLRVRLTYVSTVRLDLPCIWVCLVSSRGLYPLKACTILVEIVRMGKADAWLTRLGFHSTCLQQGGHPAPQLDTRYLAGSDGGCPGLCSPRKLNPLMQLSYCCHASPALARSKELGVLAHGCNGRRDRVTAGSCLSSVWCTSNHARCG